MRWSLTGAGSSCAATLSEGMTKLYQEGPVASQLSPRERLDNFATQGGAFEAGMLMFGGTCGAIGGVRYAPRFSF